MKPEDSQQLKLSSLCVCGKRVKELEGLLKRIEQRQAEVAETANDLVVIEKTIEIRQKQLDTLNEQLTQPHPLEIQKKKLTSDIRQLETQITSLEKRTEYEQSKLGGIGLQISEVTKTLRDLNKSISERKKYLADQEGVIDRAIEEGSFKIKSLHYETQDIEAQKQGVAASLHDLNQERSTLIDEITLIAETKATMEEEYAEREEALAVSLENVNAKIKEANIRLESITAETGRKLSKLKEKETSLIAREEALQRERVQLTTDKRRFDATRNLYD